MVLATAKICEESKQLHPAPSKTAKDATVGWREYTRHICTHLNQQLRYKKSADTALYQVAYQFHP